MMWYKLLPVCFLACFLANSQLLGSNSDSGHDGLEVVTYRGYVAMDASSVEHYGGREAVQRKLDDFFNSVTQFWNECGRTDGVRGGQNRFKYHFVFTGELMDVYEGSSTDAGKGNKLAQHVDAGRFDFFVLLDLIKDHDDERGGAYCGGVRNDGLSGVTQKVGEDRRIDFFADEARYKTMVHELGHFRGVTDVYATMCRDGLKGNPVNGEEFMPMDCVMHHAGQGVWSDYAVNIINHEARVRILGKERPNMFGELFCKQIGLSITVDGRPAKDGEITARFYGKVANPKDNGGRYIIEPAYASFKTDSSGKVVLDDIRTMYCEPNKWVHGKVPDGTNLGYGRWFNFLVVFEDQAGNALAHIWIPEYDAQMPGFEGKDVLEIKVDLKTAAGEKP